MDECESREKFEQRKLVPIHHKIYLLLRERKSLAHDTRTYRREELTRRINFQEFCVDFHLIRL